MEPRRELLISNGWIQAVAVVGLCGFLLLGILAYRIYIDEPLIPSKVIGATAQDNSVDLFQLAWQLRSGRHQQQHNND
jgi:hypothetical protein